MQTQEGKHLPVLHCISGTKGHEIVADLQVENAVVFDKPTFGSVSLAEYLQKEGFEIVEFCGVCTDICVVSNVLLFKAYCPEREIIVQSALTAGTSEENTNAALLVMRCCHVEVL
jgi:nicotinamidase-related amidase